ncbi:unnamed protein product [Durusdinium trenchii]|uniref:Uncharacterized protein n=1 Tax=Durusdinium trenchii TaxID=1381693 RepID=A0ABP0MDK9_9DINO
MVGTLRCLGFPVLGHPQPSHVPQRRLRSHLQALLKGVRENPLAITYMNLDADRNISPEAGWTWETFQLERGNGQSVFSLAGEGGGAIRGAGLGDARDFRSASVVVPNLTRRPHHLESMDECRDP